jgi:hypothetical protein
VKSHDGRLSWQARRDVAPAPPNAAAVLASRLASAPSRASPSVYILPTMLTIESGGFAADILGDVTTVLGVDDARGALATVALQSMLQDDPAAAPYGWTHALIMPMAVLENADVVADKTAAVRIAATFALGFRATLGARSIDFNAPCPTPAPDERAHDWTRIVTMAATHEDAHFAKYALACRDAAARLPSLAPLCLAAASHLSDWWAAHPGERFE